MRTAIAAAVLLMLSAGATTAQNFSGYKCNIKDTLELGKDGSAQPKRPALVDIYRKMEFIVHREDGRMFGDHFARAVPYYKVWHRGSDTNSFKTVYTSSPDFPYLYVLTLLIGENEKGAVKPFLLTEAGDLVNMHVGTCRHLD